MEPTPNPPLWQRAIGIGIGTLVGGVIYGIFLQALLIQSLIIDRRPLDPAQWREHLSSRAWICGISVFFTLVFVPLRFLTRNEGVNVLSDGSQNGVAWFLIALILLIQFATVRYATMRHELCTVEHPKETFSYGCCSTRKAAVVSADGAGPEGKGRDWLTVSFALGHWKNWVQLLIIAMEFLQLFSIAIDGGLALQTAGVSLFSQESLQGVSDFKAVVWQFGISAQSKSFDTGFGLLCGFSSLYIFLCGVFIALDLTVDSSLSPLLFTLLAGGFYSTITSGLLYVIFYSPSTTQIIVGLLMLAYYSSTAVFVSIYRSDAKKVAPGEIRVMPAFIAVERVSKGIFAAVSAVTYTSSPTLRASIALAFCLCLAGLLLRIRPYSVLGVTALRIGSVLVAAWTAFITLVASTAMGASLGPLLTGLMLGGWILIPVLVAILTRFAACLTQREAQQTVNPLQLEV